MFQSKIFILGWMMFMHIADDYYLQGCLANMKQRAWWQANAPDSKYTHDYIAALVCHSFSWAFMIMLPLAVYIYNISWILFVIANAALHGIVDDLKCNKLKINLVQDQSIHVAQIIISFVLYALIIKG